METDYIKIFDGNFIVVQLIKARLEDIGIHPIIKSETESGRLAGFGPSISGLEEVFVNTKEIEKAMVVVNEVSANTEAS